MDEYVRMLKDGATALTMEISHVRKGEITISGSECIIPVKFDKKVSYIDSNGYAFSTSAYYKTDLDMDMSVHYDMDTDECKIVSIDCTVESDKQFPKGRFVIINKDQLYDIDKKDRRYLAELRINKDTISYNEFDQAILPADIPTVNDIDVMVVPDTLMKGPNYDVMKFDFKSRKTRLKLHYGIAPLGAYDIKTPDYVSSRSDAMEAGLDIGFTWRAGRSGKMGFFFGAGVSLGNLGLSLDENLNYSYEYSVKKDGQFGLFEDFTAEYEIQSATESMKFIDIYVPIYFEIEHKVGRHLLISWNFGAKGYYNMITTYTPYSVSGIFRRSDSASRPAFRLEDCQFISPSSYRRSPYDVSVFANLGFDINIAKRKVYLSVKGGYEYGLTTSYRNSDNQYFSKADKIYPVVYNYNSKNDTHVAVHSLITNLEYTRRTIWFQAGLKFKI